MSNDFKSSPKSNLSPLSEPVEAPTNNSPDHPLLNSQHHFSQDVSHQPPANKNNPESPPGQYEHQNLPKVNEQSPENQESVKDKFANQGASTEKTNNHDFLHFIATLKNNNLPKDEIEAQWQAYYSSLPEDQKRKIWQVFKDQQLRKKSRSISQSSSPRLSEKTNIESGGGGVRSNIQAQPKRDALSRRQKSLQNIQSFLIALVVGCIVWLGLEVANMAEYHLNTTISPEVAAKVPVIVAPGENTSISEEASKLIIPSLGESLPIVYDVPYLQENEDEKSFHKRLQKALRDGVVHYPASNRPGDVGKDYNSNVVIIGHSSGNLLRSGPYRHAFINVHKLKIGDIFLINYKNKQYAYKIYKRKVVSPKAVEVLRPPADRPQSATLFTCYPPNSAKKRLIVVGEQIWPEQSNMSPVEKLEESKKLNISPGNPSITDIVF